MNKAKRKQTHREQEDGCQRKEGRRDGNENMIIK